MALRYEIDGIEPFAIEHLLLDVNGTLSDRGELIPGVDEAIAELRPEVEIQLLSADTFGTLESLASELGVAATRITTGEDKAEAVRALGAESCAAIGNGANDAEMLARARLGIVVLGPEGASPRTLAAADLLCRSVLDALRLLAEPRALAATLRR